MNYLGCEGGALRPAVQAAPCGARQGMGAMADSSGKLRVWEGWVPALLRGTVPVLLGPRGLSGLPNPHELAERLYASETLRAAGRPRDGAEPFSLQWYLDAEADRHGRHGSWLPRLLEFTKHGGERLLGLGAGLGTDWVQYARHGAAVTACASSADQLALVQRNFELRGLHGTFLNADPAALPVETATIDVVCLVGLLPEAPDPRAVVEEIYRVLKPGGKVVSVVRACYDIDYWRNRFLPWSRWLGPGRGRGEALAPGYSARALRRLFGRFGEARVYKRHLRRREVPHLWRWLPHPLLERLLGRMLVCKAFKPLSTAMTVHLAA
jgi:SAM-dependent methyltransferase